MQPNETVRGAVLLTNKQMFYKRLFDITLSCLGLLLTGWLIVFAIFAARFDTGKTGLFRQVRIGRKGRRFQILKIRTMRDIPGMNSTVTASTDMRITRLGAWFRKTKIDELPQLVNVLRGDMSFVGPRPDVPEIAERLQWLAPEVLTVRPGITGPASLKYRFEEEILAAHECPESLNESYIFPDKTLINLRYVRSYSFRNDLKFLWQTITGTGHFAMQDELEVSKNNDKLAA